MAVETSWLLLILVAVSVAAQTTQRPAEPLADYRIAEVRAQLFFSDRGTFSENLIGRKDLALWNTIIGGGDAGGRSNSMVVIIAVSGRPGSYDGKRQVELRVRDERGEVFRRQQHLSVLNTQGGGYVAFWLYDIGCEPLTLAAVITGQKTNARKAESIPFKCGE